MKTKGSGRPSGMDAKFTGKFGARKTLALTEYIWVKR